MGGSPMVDVVTAMMVITTMVAVVPFTCRAIINDHHPLAPVVLVPGAGGNQLEARLTAEYKATSWLCNRFYPIKKEEGGWFRLWFDIGVLLAPFTECFADRMTLYYNPELDDYKNAPGVETRVSEFGSTQSLLYLDPYLKYITTYMAPLVKSLQNLGYTDGQTLFGAPYDFRYGLAADGHPSNVGSTYLQNLKNLIEKASDSNNGNPIIIISHSLGGLFVLQLLNRNPPMWRQRYIKHFIALSAPWGGTVDEMLTFASGNALGVPLVNPLLVRNEQRSSESNLWLMPRKKQFPPEKPLVVTRNSTYSSYEISRFLEDIGFPEGVQPYETRILPLVEKLVAPGVPITCIIGSGVQTPESLYYRDEGFDKQPEIIYGDGDGTVNMASLLALEDEWKDEEFQRLKVVKLDGISHTNILKDEEAVAKITKEVFAISSSMFTSIISS
ncbi:lecithin-cholesterol acyltransferase-like 1 [Cynara cardunculus var. scolymus]|uniref:lecithin-cholesterol acyltransferase-like 1 n=1 Tax=Cynara cardunculus var. scolymus TaxID=59895 RepID=UPI000D625848|nr:lecithin-cholesterol acyltransferase-like 1 [Cynara cardunculus var. scolymus]